MAQAVPSLVLDYKTEKQHVTELVLKPRQCVQEVPVVVAREMKTIDPATGKEILLRKQVAEVRKVKVTVYEPTVVERDVVVRVPCVSSTDKVVLVKRTCVFPTQEAAIEKRYHVLPVDSTLTVPPCPPLPQCPPLGVKPDNCGAAPVPGH